MNTYSASYRYFPLKFKKPAGTSRGYLTEKPSWLLTVKDLSTGAEGLGECSLIPGLSIDDEERIETVLKESCRFINENGLDGAVLSVPRDFPAVRFAVETAILDVKGGGRQILYDNFFSRGEKGILINGLVWMGSIDDMLKQAGEKIDAGYKCLKFKVGALDFNAEFEMVKKVRQTFGNSLEIRLDANGGFSDADAIYRLEKLASLTIHSIEQPVKPGSPVMEALCAASPIPIALDEELIGVYSKEEKMYMLARIKPAYIILKPSLIGGLAAADEWIRAANETNTGWWATSALESNIGLNAIAQWVANYQPALPQGLGTGGLYEENFPLPLEIKNACLQLIR